MKKGNNFLVVISILALLVMIAGTTFSFFTVTTTSANSAVNMTSAEIDTGVVITAVYNEKPLIPLNDDDIDLAYSELCVDIHNYGACQIYDITISNNGDPLRYTGSINFTVSDIANLKYILYDEDDNHYTNAIPIVSGTDQTLGNSFQLGRGESTTFKLVIWLTNFEESQNDYDAGGSFSALVTYETPYNTTITGTFSVS